MSVSRVHRGGRSPTGEGVLVAHTTTVDLAVISGSLPFLPMALHPGVNQTF